MWRRLLEAHAPAAICGALLLPIAIALVSAATAGDPTGLWLTAEGESQIRVAPCATFAAADAKASTTGVTRAKARAAPVVAAGAPTQNAYCGRIAWLREPIDPETRRPKSDVNNPDAALRSRPLIGMPILLDMKPGATPGVWEGQVYNALNGKTYSANISLDKPNSLKIQGCVFGGFFCGSSFWTRVD